MVVSSRDAPAPKRWRRNFRRKITVRCVACAPFGQISACEFPLAFNVVTVAFKNLPFSGPVTVDRYVIDTKTGNLDYWLAAGKIPASVQATQLQKAESFSAASVGSNSWPTLRHNCIISSHLTP